MARMEIQCCVSEPSQLVCTTEIYKYRPLHVGTFDSERIGDSMSSATNDQTNIQPNKQTKIPITSTAHAHRII